MEAVGRFRMAVGVLMFAALMAGSIALAGDDGAAIPISFVTGAEDMNSPLTREAVESLKTCPEFSGLSADDILRGKELLEERKKTAAARIVDRKTSEKVGKTGLEKRSGKSLFELSRLADGKETWGFPEPFGYEFFRTAARRITTDRDDTLVPAKYIVSPGDRVKLQLWGRLHAQHNLVVDPGGTITIPEIGPLSVSGKTFADLSREIAEKYGQLSGITVDVTLGAFKTLSVYILGDVHRQGTFRIGTQATISDALILAGGPTKLGSMRNIQLKRKGDPISTLDLYDFLMKGDRSKDAVLVDGDVVFVPVVGPLVGITGNVRQPAAYELRSRYDLEGVIGLAGGMIPSGYTQRIQVERLVSGKRQIVYGDNEKNREKVSSFRLQDRDLIEVSAIANASVDTVFLAGNLKRPGRYGIKPGTRVGDLIKTGNDPLPGTYFNYALVVRPDSHAVERTLLPFDLGALLRGDEDQNLELRPRDSVYVFNRGFFKDRPSVLMEGEISCALVENAGDSGEDDEELPAMLASLRAIEDSFRSRKEPVWAEKIRNIADTIRRVRKVRTGGLHRMREELSGLGKNEYAGWILDVETRFRNSCRVAIEENMRLRDALLAAGGLTEDAYLDQGEIVRGGEGQPEIVSFSPSQAMAGRPEDNPVLRRRDRIVIHAAWEHLYRKNVFIEGEVRKPGAYEYTDGMTVRDLILRAGNVLESAVLDDAEITSVYADVFRRGRRSVDLGKALAGDPADNARLGVNDRLMVKRIPEWGLRHVVVSGEFRFPGRYAIQKGEKLSSLIARAGGYTAHAYLRGAFFTRSRIREEQQKGLDDMAARAERELLLNDSAIDSGGLEANRSLVERLRRLKAMGRTVIALSHPRTLKGTPQDIELEDGDTLQLPHKGNVVNVVGAASSEGLYPFGEGLVYRDYIRMAGGYSANADRSNAFVAKVDGSIRKVVRDLVEWSDQRRRWEITEFNKNNLKIEPGDVIVVPERVTAIPRLKKMRDISQVILDAYRLSGGLIRVY